jgi:hypothetical protein
MKRLVVNAFCPGEHKLVSSLAAEADLSFPLPLTEARAPSIISKRNEPALMHK